MKMVEGVSPTGTEVTTNKKRVLKMLKVEMRILHNVNTVKILRYMCLVYKFVVVRMTSIDYIHIDYIYRQR